MSLPLDVRHPAPRVLVAPVLACTRGGRRQLCPDRLNSIGSWYAPRPRTRTFVIDDLNADGLGTAVSSLGRPLRVERFGPLRVFVYAHDVAPRLR